ncbi:MAG: helix-turn-helix domain-containing protein [Clostridia bacterium]
MSDFRNYLNEQLKNDEFKAEYEKLEPEFSIIQAVIDARKSTNITQKELAERTGIAQSDISKLENGNSNPTLGMLKRLADGMGMTVKLQFVPKAQR